MTNLRYVTWSASLLDNMAKRHMLFFSAFFCKASVYEIDLHVVKNTCCKDSAMKQRERRILSASKIDVLLEEKKRKGRTLDAEAEDSSPMWNTVDEGPNAAVAFNGQLVIH
ncbi:hypothetical protein Tco_1122048 [Tanacetum coccineum]|uniref:Uncharacterized protein n=1 Tax=Tanacetum coccineum TaxID=301880 RepID=A0ABQ5IZG0_9ASTR